MQFLHDSPNGSSRREKLALCARIPILIFTRPDFVHSPGLPYSSRIKGSGRTRSRTRHPEGWERISHVKLKAQWSQSCRPTGNA